MKKLLLITSFLASQLFAVQCTEKQYSTFFGDTQEVRYAVASTQNSDNSRTVVDKKSIKFDKKKQIIQVWTIAEVKSEPTIGYWKILYEFDIENNNWRYPQAIAYNCDGSRIDSDKYLTWQSIPPGSTVESLVVAMKGYLSIE